MRLTARRQSRRLLLLRLAAVAGIGAGCSSTHASVDGALPTEPPCDDAGEPLAALPLGGMGGGMGNDVVDAGGDGGKVLLTGYHPAELCVLRGPPASTPGDTLVYREDFDGIALDTKMWTQGSGKRGPWDVLSAASPAHVAVHDGSLFITADHAPSGAPDPYVAGYVDTLGKYARTYGKVELRARFPYNPGVWHAMWGRPWFDNFPELDIEILNTAAVTHSQLYFVNHWAAPPIPADQRRSFVKIDDIDVSAFHSYTVSWTPGLVEWAVDGVTKMRAVGQGVPTKPVYWIVNSWVGGWGGTPPSSTPMPIDFEVDYLHVYRVDGLIADPEIHLVNAVTTYSREDVINVAIANFDEACVHVEMYDGDIQVAVTSAAPYAFSTSVLTLGPHKLVFVATDGVRRTTTTTLDVDIEVD